MLSPAAQELRALLRRVPDGFQATLNSLASRDDATREALMTELARALGKDFLPLVRGAARHRNPGLSATALLVLPRFGTRAAADVLAEIYAGEEDPARRQMIQISAQALAARGIRVSVPLPETGSVAPQMVVRETLISMPNMVGTQTAALRMQDQYGSWYTLFVLVNDQVGVKDGFMTAISRHEWTEMLARHRDRGEIPEIPCPFAHVRRMVESGRSLNEVSGFPLGRCLDDWDRTLATMPAEPYEPIDPCELLAGMSETEIEAHLDRSGSLPGPGGGIRWWLDEEDAAGVLDQVLSAPSVGLGTRLNPDEIPRVMSSLLQPVEANRAHQRDRVAECARCLLWKKDADGAVALAAVVRALERGKPIEGIPFFSRVALDSLEVAMRLRSAGTSPAPRYDPMRRY